MASGVGCASFAVVEERTYCKYDRERIYWEKVGPGKFAMIWWIMRQLGRREENFHR